MRIVVLPVFLIVVPVILGLPWCCVLMKNNAKRTLSCLPMGYFLELAVFQLLTFPFACMCLSFSALCNTFIIIIGLCCLISLVWLMKKQVYRFPKIKITGWTSVYLIIFVVILGYQIINAVALDRTYMSYDDAGYIAYANDALKQNSIFMINDYTGIGVQLNIRRALQGSLLYPAFLSYVSGVEVITMEHTILDIYYLILAYIVYSYLGIMCFKNENVLIFLITISVLYIYGNYTMYSPTMRLLGINYVGKAILAVIFMPFLFSLLIHGLRLSYRTSFGLILLLLSISASGLSLFGTAMMVINVSISVALSLRHKPRRWGYLGYILFSSIFPMVYMGIFIVNRFNFI